MSKKIKKFDRCYIVRNERHDWNVGGFFTSEKAARSYVEKYGDLNTDYAIFFCEKTASASTNIKPVWADH